MIPSPHPRSAGLAVVLLNAFVALRVVAYGWVTDDAFITLRSVRNFVAGDGPVFNIGERVQSFTHPLWFFLLSWGGAMDVNLYFWAILCGFACTAVTLVLLHRLHVLVPGSLPVYLAGLILLGFSQPFLTFATSGLESSMTIAICMSMLVVAFDDSTRLERTRLVVLLFSAAVLTRFDNLLLVFPLLVMQLAAARRAARLRAGEVVLALSPLAAWHAFSLVYYGFLFPNTKYAKLGGRALGQTVRSGLAYSLDSFQGDMLGFAVMATLLLFGGFVLLRRGLGDRVEGKPVFLAALAGMVLHLAYTICVAGGDFMRGRFFVPSLVLSVALLLLVRVALVRAAAPALAGLALLAFASNTFAFRETHFWFHAAGVADERNFYKKQLGLNLEPMASYPFHPWAIDARSLGQGTDGRPVAAIWGVNGQWGYWTDRGTRLYDPVALTDAFIARLPVADNARSGHFQHVIPDEYQRIRIHGERIERWRDPAAQELYDRVIEVTESKELFTVRRWQAMAWLWGGYGF